MLACEILKGDAGGRGRKRKKEMYAPGSEAVIDADNATYRRGWHEEKMLLTCSSPNQLQPSSQRRLDHLSRIDASFRFAKVEKGV